MPENRPYDYRLKKASAGQQAEALKPKPTPSPSPTPDPTAAQQTARENAARIGQETSEDTHQKTVDREKYDPAARSGEMSADEVKAKGGLGALAAARRKKATQ